MRKGVLIAAVGACVLLGAIGNVVVAWWFALYDVRWTNISAITTPGKYPVAPPQGWGANPSVEVAHTRGTTTIITEPPITQFRTGWPLRSLAWACADSANERRRAMQGMFSTIQRPDGTWTNAIINPAPPRQPPSLGFFADGIDAPDLRARLGRTFVAPNTDGFDRRLPTQPLPLGFVVNTLLYALPLMVPILIFRWIASSRQKSKDLCTHCGYSLAALPTGAPCPECGKHGSTRARSIP
jgi:hypothetical protein